MEDCINSENINDENNYHVINITKCCCTCKLVKRPDYPFDWECGINNKVVDPYGICDNYTKRDIII